MLEGLFGSASKERVLAFIYARQEGYPREIAKFWNCSLLPIQKQLDKLERDGILFRKMYGRTVVYKFNPRYFLKNELEAILKKTVSLYSPELKEGLLCDRKRPRVKGKPAVLVKTL